MAHNPYQSPRGSGKSSEPGPSPLAGLSAAPRWILGGLLGGAAGAAIWVIVGLVTHLEVGWIAWGVGFLTGAGLRYAAYLGGDEESQLQGVLAAALAIVSVVAAKFLVGWLDGFETSFGLFDLLWFGLAIITAYKIGVGSYTSE